MAASRRNAPSYALDATIYGPMEERCREALDEGRLVRLSSQGEAMDHQQLLDLVGADELVIV